jgi:Zn-dependent protease/predicted transcriptional regulator
MSQPSARPTWSFRIATIAGIPVRVHVTFLLLGVYLAMVSNSTEAGGRMSVTVLLVFFCVVLHEFGHALTARKFGIRTQDITIFPIGGVAVIKDRPKPVEEFWIAIAGPLVNVAIAAVLGGIYFAIHGQLPSLRLNLAGVGILEAVFAANVFLPVFNMIPAFPMDGGRVLRALLAMRIGDLRATRAAGGLGQVLAIGFGLFGMVTGDFVIILIALFVFVGAGQEVTTIESLSLAEGFKVSDAMMTSYWTLPPNATLDHASRLMLEGAQRDFPVVLGDELLGILSSESLVAGLSAEGGADYVSGHMNRSFSQVGPNDPLESAFRILSDGAKPPLAVVQGEKLVGLLTLENLGEFMMIRRANASR